ncbi:uncharacterized protein LOC126896371 [Daktulosphaira vitifoliae]|uniref:uncharacterized protein LOC126896371 n=1 Tax=Daktulosphaira vitifoliae TaxID=58002 RepID=UPI0021A99931|nr:uncharacterized protein LOC126896371 [Daktulosphaira vitifoliae]
MSSLIKDYLLTDQNCVINVGDIFRLNDREIIKKLDALRLIKSTILMENMKVNRPEPVNNSVYIFIMEKIYSNLFDGILWTSNGTRKLSLQNNTKLMCRYYTSNNLCKKMYTLLSEKHNASYSLIHYTLKRSQISINFIDDVQDQTNFLNNSVITIKNEESFLNEEYDDKTNLNYSIKSESSSDVNETCKITILPDVKKQYENELMDLDKETIPAKLHSFSVKSFNWHKYHELFLDQLGGHVSYTPPINPKPGQIYVYNNENNPNVWKFDEYSWCDQGHSKFPKTTKNRDSLLYRIFYKCRSNPYFKRQVWFKYDAKKRKKLNGLVIVHYNGFLNYVENKYLNRHKISDTIENIRFNERNGGSMIEYSSCDHGELQTDNYAVESLPTISTIELKFTLEEEDELIKEVHKNDPLINTTQDITYKNELSENIENTIGKSVDDCQKICENIKSSHICNKRKLSIGSTSPKKKKLECMSFLKKITLNSASNEEENTKKVEETEFDTLICSISKSNVSPQFNENHLSNLVDKHKLNILDKLSVASANRSKENIKMEQNQIVLNHQRHEDDDVDLFFKSLALTVKKLPKKAIKEAKIKLLIMVNELEDEYTSQAK